METQMQTHLHARLWARFTSLLNTVRLPPGDLLRDRIYRRLWSSILISSLGGQITMLALPLTAAVLLHASPTQMGLLTAMEIAPFVLFSLPGGVLLDRVRKLPVYVTGEVMLALAVATVPVAAWTGLLGMGWLYVVGFILGCVNTIAGSAAQIVLTQVVSRDRLVEAHAKNALASSGADVAGPGIAGLLIKALGAPIALAVDAGLVMISALILRGLRIEETLHKGNGADFWRDLKAGLQVRPRARAADQPGLHGRCLADVQQRGAGRADPVRHARAAPGRPDRRPVLRGPGRGHGAGQHLRQPHQPAAGPGPLPGGRHRRHRCRLLTLAVMPANGFGVAAFAFMLFTFGVGAVLIFINFLALRQSVTPAPMLGRMTSTMRWLILIPAGPGALLGGFLGEHVGLRSALLFAGIGALALSAVAWRHPVIRRVKELPRVEQAEADHSALAAELVPNK